MSTTNVHKVKLKGTKVGRALCYVLENRFECLRVKITYSEMLVKILVGMTLASFTETRTWLGDARSFQIEKGELFSR